MLLDRYPQVRARSPKDAEQWLLSEYSGGELHAQARSEFSFSTNIVTLSRIRMLWYECSTEAEMTLPPAPYLRYVFPVGLPIRITSGQRSCWDVPVSAGCLVPSGEGLRLQHGPNYRHFALGIEPDVVEKTLAALIGNETEPLALDFGVPNQGLNQQFLLQAAIGLAQEINALGAPVLPALRAEIEQSLLVRFLIYSAHNYQQRVLGRPGSVSRSRVDQAEQFIRENWDRPLDFQELARVSNTSIRSLFRKFKETRGYSPSDFAKRIRLEQARLMIMQGDGLSIMAIALRCGFQNLGRFAADYRDQFGERPSDTRQMTRTRS